MRLEIFESGLLQRAIRRHVESIRLAEQPLQLQPLKVELGAAPHAFDTGALVPALRLGDMQMHVSLLAVAEKKKCRGAQRRTSFVLLGPLQGWPKDNPSAERDLVITVHAILI